MFLKEFNNISGQYIISILGMLGVKKGFLINPKTRNPNSGRRILLSAAPSLGLRALSRERARSISRDLLLPVADGLSRICPRQSLNLEAFVGSLFSSSLQFAGVWLSFRSSSKRSRSNSGDSGSSSGIGGGAED